MFFYPFVSHASKSFPNFKYEKRLIADLLKSLDNLVSLQAIATIL